MPPGGVRVYPNQGDAMGVSVEGGKGHGKGLMVDLNLVPFIDYMSCLIAFLMIVAVWTQVASLDLEQSIGGPPPDFGPEVPPPPPVTVHVRADGVWVGRWMEKGVRLPKQGEDYDVGALAEWMRADHAAFPREDMVVINTDDGVPYAAMIQVLDLSRELGYPRTLLAGGPASVEPG